ncbi:MAG: YifB family Mg chelatase-like AAA ATPase [Parcubacteria group bacterium]|nr:YifB family Mg chelatase-like AAA ATPase [Parcubacteria group bacterium]
MLAKLLSAATHGLNAFPVEVETNISSSFPSFSIVGLADKAVDEAKERVRAALENSDFPLKFNQRIVVNLAPADLKKEGTFYDVPIALALLVADGILDKKYIPEKAIFVGELSLDGRVRYSKGILPIAVFARKEKYVLFLPRQNIQEVSLVKGLKIVPMDSLKELLYFLGNKKTREEIEMNGVGEHDFPVEYEIDFSHIAGQEYIKRGLEIVAAGGHNVLMSGPPGTGKSLLAKSLPSILPRMTEEEIIDVTKIYSVAGLLREDRPFIADRPFRSPHHTISDIALVGGGQHPRPGEASLAHCGVLFLDEIAEFGRSAIEALRQALEDKIISVARAKGHVTFPASFMLVATQNPCPCGYLNDTEKQCVCSPSHILRYQKRLSGPLLDRVDLFFEVPRVEFIKLKSEAASESSEKVRARVSAARERQYQRFENESRTNSGMKLKEIKKICALNAESEKLFENAFKKYALSPRAYHRILKVARTIADLAESERIETPHLMEALQYRIKGEERYL